MPLLALGGASLTAALIYILAYRKADGLSPTRLILIGIAVAAGINACQLVLALRLDPNNYQFVATWIAGKIWGRLEIRPCSATLDSDSVTVRLL